MKSPLRILLLEDNASDAELIQGLLAADGLLCDITRVQTRAEFLTALEATEPDLILADYRLPSFDGLSALKLAQKTCPDLPFIFVSGTLGEEVAIEALKIGATDYILKTGLSRLVPSVERALREARERAERKRAEEAALRSEKELRDVIEALPTMAFSVSPDGTTVWINQRWAEYSGLSVEDTSASKWQAIVHPDDRERHLTKWLQALANGEPFENEARHRSVQDEYRWLLVRSVPLRDEQGQIVRWYGTLTDLEDRKRAEALLAGEKRILEMVAKGDSLAEILDSLCRLVEQQASSVLASILLVDEDRLWHGAAPSLPRAYTEAIDGAAIGAVAGSCGTAAYRREQVIVEDIETDPLWAEYRDLARPYSLRACWSTPVFSAENKVIGTFAMYYREPRSPSRRDQEIIEQITHLAGVAIERKLTYDQLRRSEAYLAEAEKLTNIGSWAFRMDSKRAVYWSEENFRIWALDPQQGLPDREDLLQRVHPEDRELVEAAHNAIGTGGDYAIEFRIVRPDGTVRYLHGLGHHVLRTSGEPVEVVGTHVDVTERKRAEEEREKLRALEDDLAHINRVSMLGELAASLAHEIKQPLAAAVANAEASARWLRRESPDFAEASDAASAMVSDVKRAAEIIDRVRSLYGHGRAHSESIDVNDVIRDMTGLLRDTANRNYISIRTKLGPQLPKTTADRIQLQQVLMNLMLNGIDAMKDKGGELTVTSAGTDGGELLISVSDLGIGLPSQDGDRLFEAFFTTKPQGSGMGLSISRRIIEAHGGRLWATSNLPRGAVFQFTLPINPGVAS